jgi:16S rRNA C967 or C1407 C5-methylase (RsmB/RsmF family)/NOL1/NOP2/fmu family ribosome biogenesis protein
MERLLGPELPAFLASLQEPPVRGLRINPAKVGAEELSRLLGVSLTQVPWCATGFVLPADAPSLGSHPAIDCGLFYLQDPASMVAPAVLAPEPGWRVADVAAAPGGKATDLAARVGPEGLLLANEVVRPRLRLLESALDRWGSPAVVTSALALERLAGSWDAVLLDAPCTGEALFRRDPHSAREWGEASVRGNAKRQARLLDAVAPLVRPGGVLVYSTCSFELTEDEEQVAGFLDRHAGWELENAVIDASLSPGLPAGDAVTARTARVWPHRGPGDGQFVARLLRTGDGPTRDWPGRHAEPSDRRDSRAHRRAALAGWHAFRDETLPGFDPPDEAIRSVGDALYLLPDAATELDPGILSRPGLPLGRRRPGRFEPAHALATAIQPDHAAQVAPWSAAYLRGETVPDPGPDGWTLLCFERWGLGWARRSRGVLKNFFPKALRRATPPLPASRSGAAPRAPRPGAS